MNYTYKEVKSEIGLDDLRKLANCMRDVQKNNERDIYDDKPELMGHEGFRIPSQVEYERFITAAITEEDAKVFAAFQEDEVVGLAIGGITAPEHKTGRGSGRIMFFWSHENLRKTLLVKKLYKSLFGWFNDRNCINVSLTVKNFQSHIAKFFMSRGYKMNNVELVGPVRFRRGTV